jgi:hypothetical protein
MDEFQRLAFRRFAHAHGLGQILRLLIHRNLGEIGKTGIVGGRNAVNVFKDSIRVSNAVSQFAVPLISTTVFGVSVISSPNGSAVRSGAGDGVGAVALLGGVGFPAAGGVPVGLVEGGGLGLAGAS